MLGGEGDVGSAFTMIIFGHAHAKLHKRKASLRHGDGGIARFEHFLVNCRQ